MHNKSGHYSHAEISSIFALLDPQDVEHFYRSYHLWILYRQITSLQKSLTALRQQIAINNERMQQMHPSAITLATLARLQSNGVNDISLLDRMLERGEVWLDQTMQRLAYCERFDFIRDNYTEWCENALDGAYDWIDSMQEANALSSPDELALTAAPLDSVNGSLSEATEEMLLQKLMSEEDNEAGWQEPTLKRPSVSSATEVVSPPTDTPSTEDAQSRLASTPEEVEVLSPQEEPETEQGSERPPDLEGPEEQIDKPTNETSEPETQSDEIAQETEEQVPQSDAEEAVSSPSVEEVIFSEDEVSDIPEAASSSIGQVTELEAAAEPTNGQASEVEHVEPVLAVEETIPVEINADLLHVPGKQAREDEAAGSIPIEVASSVIEQEQPSEQVDAVSHESEEVPLMESEDMVPALEAPLAAGNDTPRQRSEFTYSEGDASSSQAGAEQSSIQTSTPAVPRKKRGFLRRLLAMFFGKKRVRQ